MEHTEIQQARPEHLLLAGSLHDRLQLLRPHVNHCTKMERLLRRIQEVGYEVEVVSKIGMFGCALNERTVRMLRRHAGFGSVFEWEPPKCYYFLFDVNKLLRNEVITRTLKLED